MKISYIISHGVAEWVKIDRDGDEELVLSFDPKYDGTLILDGLYTVKGGEVSIALTALKNGEYNPKFECADGCFAVEGFTKSGGDVVMKSNCETLARSLLKRCYELERREHLLSKRLSAIEEITKGHNIFNFERNKR